MSRGNSFFVITEFYIKNEKNRDVSIYLGPSLSAVHQIYVLQGMTRTPTACFKKIGLACLKNGEKIVKAIGCALAFSGALLLSAVLANAEGRFDGYFGLGTMQVGSNNALYQNSNTGEIGSAPHMGGVFGTIGGGLMLTPTYGFGAQVAFRFTKGEYAIYGYRPIFYDFNGIYTPRIGKIVLPEFQAGFGGVNLRFYDASNPYLDNNTGKVSTFAGSANHFQLHASAGLRFKFKSHVWLRPQVDYHWVNNFEQFGSNNVLGYSLAIGFSAGER
jgi:hypothetical protein